MSQFGFRASPNTQSAVSSGPSQPSPPPSSMAVTSSAPTPGSPPAPTQRCCDTGRPLFTDPITGQSVCSCQYELLGYQRLAGGVPGLPALSMYSAPYPEGMAAYFPALGADQAPFYTSTVNMSVPQGSTFGPMLCSFHWNAVVLGSEIASSGCAARGDLYGAGAATMRSTKSHEFA